MAKREKFAERGPHVRKLVDRIVHGAFTTEGTMVAFPTCFPGVTVPVPADESRITALDVTPGTGADSGGGEAGVVYAGTSGQASHLLVGMFHGVTGMVYDLGVAEGADRCAGIACGASRFVAAVNSPAGGRLIGRKLQRLPFDLIQEWGFDRPPLEPLEADFGGESILHLVRADDDGRFAVGTTPTRLFRCEIDTGAVDFVADAPGRGRLARGPWLGSIVGPDDGATLFRYDIAGSGGPTRRAILLPPGGAWNATDRPRMVARDPVRGTLYTADDAGTLFALDESGRFSEALGRVPVAPVGPMTVTFDGRLFGTYGEGMAKLFCYDPADGKLSSLGVAVSVFERRRYGYAFADATVGRDGQIILGEDDDLGHLWLYFPRIRGNRA